MYVQIFFVSICSKIKVLFSSELKRNTRKLAENKFRTTEKSGIM